LVYQKSEKSARAYFTGLDYSAAVRTLAPQSFFTFGSSDDETNTKNRLQSEPQAADAAGGASDIRRIDDHINIDRNSMWQRTSLKGINNKANVSTQSADHETEPYQAVDHALRQCS